MKRIFKFIILNILILTSLGQVQAHSHFQVEQLLGQIKNLSLPQKIEKSSAFFLGDKTKIGPLGEGKKGKFDRDPLYSFKAFDCTTYIETVMALSLAEDLQTFKEKLIHIRYLDGTISFKKRNHFISLDWIPSNFNILKDITASIGNVRFARATIDKKNWYQKKGPSDIRGREDLTGQRFRDLVKELKNLGKDFTPQIAEVPYLPLRTLFNNPSTLKSIPHGSIINVVRPNWDLRDSIGTHLNISHQGIAIWKRGKLFYRHASSFPDKMVKDTPFKKYFEKYLNSGSLKGINIQELN